MTNAEPRSLFELRQKLRPWDTGMFEKRHPDSKKLVLSPKNGEHATDCATNCAHLAARQQETYRPYLWLAILPAVSFRRSESCYFKTRQSLVTPSISPRAQVPGRKSSFSSVAWVQVTQPVTFGDYVSVLVYSESLRDNGRCLRSCIRLQKIWTLLLHYTMPNHHTLNWEPSRAAGDPN